MRSRNAAWALVGCLALIAPAAVLARGGPAPEVEALGTAGEQAVWGTSAATSTNSGQFQPIQNLAQGAGVPIDMSSPSPLQVSVDLRAGKMELRVIDGDGGDLVAPRPVLFSGKGVSTATLYMAAGTELEDPLIEWKRVGDKRVRAASVVAHVLGVPD